MIKETSVLDVVYWISRANKSILPETIKKWFIKAVFWIGFQCNENFVKFSCFLNKPVETIEEIGGMCTRGQINVQAKTLTTFDNELSKDKGLNKATDFFGREDDNNETNNTYSNKQNYETVTKFLCFPLKIF